ncbi:MAG TPA: CPBP family intramembrane glutamic endopeptidase [Prolixibacteraceae bacterium]|nr:CPBP family intramembrane glutamic endopeptidase [Prolixibacteraceae bacterium]
MKSIYRDMHPISKIAVTTLVALSSLLIIMIVSSVLAIPIFGVDSFLQLLTSSLTIDAANINLLKYFQLWQSIGMFIVPALLLALLFGNSIGEYLSLKKSPKLVSALLASLIVLCSSPIINVLGVWNSGMELPSFMSGIENWMKQSEESAAQITKLFVFSDSMGGLLYNIFLIALIPAIGEEFLFRGVIQRVLTDWTKNKHLGIWIAAIFFSAFHLQFYGFIPRVFLGAMFGYLLVWSGNLWLPVIAHFVNNAAAVIAYHLYNNGAINVDPDELGVGSAYGIAAISSLLVVVVLFYFFYHKQKKQNLYKEPLL